MSLFHEQVKKVMRAVDKFVGTTLKDVKLAKSVNAERLGIIQLLEETLHKYDSINWKNDQDVNVTVQSQQSEPDDGEDIYEDTDNVSRPEETPPVNTKKGKDKPLDSISTSSADPIETDSSYKGPGIAFNDLSSVKKYGYLNKRRKKEKLFSKIAPGTQRRWCAISKGIFYYYEKAQDKKQNGAFYIKDYEARPCAGDEKSKDTGFNLEMVCPGKRTYQFSADSKDDLDEWVDAFNKASGYVSRGSGSSTTAPDDAEENYEDPNETLPPKKVVPPSLPKRNEVKPPPPPPEDSEELYEDTDVFDPPAKPAVSPPSKPAPPVVQEEIYDETEVAATEEIYDETMVETEETYDETEIKSPARPLPTPPVNKPLPTPPTTPSKPLPTPPSESRALPIPPTDQTRELPKPPQGTPESPQDVNPEDLYYGILECKSDAAQQLGFKRGDVLQILSRDRKYDEHGWWVARLEGSVGIVPKKFLSPAYQLVE